jgi:predicted secreted protein
MKHILLLSIVLSFSLGCSESSQPTEPQLGSDMGGKSAIYLPNQQFSLKLDLNADGGYQWDCSISDTTVVRIDSTRFRSKSGEIVAGGLVVETFYFRTMTIGHCMISLKECRGWERGTPPIHIVQFWVVVV